MERNNDEPSAGHRHARLEGLVLEELRGLLSDDVADPTLWGVRITGIVLSVDYKHARVHFAVKGTTEEVRARRSAVESALRRATPFLRARLADGVEIKRLPDLKFIFEEAAPLSENEENETAEDDECPE
jgi:ribosome-binding factor A